MSITEGGDGKDSRIVFGEALSEAERKLAERIIGRHIANTNQAREEFERAKTIDERTSVIARLLGIED